MFNLAGGKLAVCGIAAAFIVGGACLAVWPRQFAEPDGDDAGGPPTAAQVWGIRAGGVLMALGGAALLAVVPPDPDPVLF